MTRVELKISLTVIVSLFLHIIIISGIMLPRFDLLLDAERLKRKWDSVGKGGRDIIVNINQDNIRRITKKTLLSDKDSTARGHLTLQKGDRWLNNSLDFKLKAGRTGMGRGKAKVKKRKTNKKNILLSEKSEVVVFLEKNFQAGELGQYGEITRLSVPDKYDDISKKNAIYYSNREPLSFPTVMFKNFNYFRRMKDKIARNWHPPVMAMARIGGIGGSTRIRAIANKRFKLYFVMNRKGDVKDVVILQRDGTKVRKSNSPGMENQYPFREACLDAIWLSKTFGDVPDNIRGDYIIIKFIFHYIVN